MAIAGALLKMDARRDAELEAQELAAAATAENVVEVSENTPAAAAVDAQNTVVPGVKIKKIIVACDAGMGSSAMGASVLRNRLKKAQIEGVEVKNASISNLPDDVDLIITHFDLMKRAKSNVSRPNVSFMGIRNFVEATQYDEIIHQVKENNA
ncbi:TPA: hypothetical protein L9141_004713 [Klebsiella pneumoniae]|nr:hypothetical protein [Klebsiella pneumoniae]HBR7936530.1 hypothetical protein [Klebsiella pneumoniae]HBR7952284.1 hypothetical protein [Klebsiella pneumoniae]HBR7957887.1 hypothetical protein [Klebsiella pneumoniae]HBR7979320.1 hypothetical protein [Klebsiella pneumoniae]